jgi:chemotaxis protein methyltransferase CheR
MPFSPENLGVSEAGLPLLRELIHQQTGLFYENGRSELLSDRLAPLVVARGFRSYLDLYYLLKFDPVSADSAWRDVMDALSVQETYFWREVDQLQALTCHVLPELLRATPGATVRIWSIPCATGEEPLSIAMALEEAGWFDRARIEIHASDASPAAIAKARPDCRERSFRSLPGFLRDKYFEPRGTQWTPTASLQRRITSWTMVNLMARDEMLTHASSQIVFCRNAFIYFSRDSVKQVVKTFEDAMPVPAYLFVGASESLSKLSDHFLLEDVDRAFVYTKR